LAAESRALSLTQWHSVQTGETTQSAAASPAMKEFYQLHAPSSFDRSRDQLYLYFGKSAMVWAIR
jgi:hypothetical protein